MRTSRAQRFSFPGKGPMTSCIAARIESRRVRQSLMERTRLTCPLETNSSRFVRLSRAQSGVAAPLDPEWSRNRKRSAPDPNELREALRAGIWLLRRSTPKSRDWDRTLLNSFVTGHIFLRLRVGDVYRIRV